MTSLMGGSETLRKKSEEGSRIFWRLPPTETNEFCRKQEGFSSMADLALVLADDLIQIRSMSIDPHHAFDQTVLDQIEHSAVGAVPMTPSYQDALKRLYASHQVYASADHRDGHVTARSLVGLPSFYAEN